MREDILINVLPFETRVVLLQDGAVAEVRLERSQGRGSITGNIYRGRVERILPGLQAAFVDIGAGQPGFLHLADIEGATADDRIRDVLRDEQSLLVQIIKDPIGTKGARLRTSLSIPSRYLVLMMGSDHIGVSQRIGDEAERRRLGSIVDGALAAGTLPAGTGVIVRTAAEGRPAEDIVADLEFLNRIRGRVEGASCHGGSGLIYEDLPVHTQVIRDLLSDATASIRVDDSTTLQQVARFIERFAPEFRDRVELHDGEVGLFETFDCDRQIDAAVQPQVPLKCGGYLLIEQTEAMVTVDVNTGANVGHRNEGKGLGETVYRTNLEAAAVIPDQLRLRNLGGIVIIDFIDMHKDEHRRDILRMLEKGFARDRVPTRVAPFSSLGLVEVSRKRTRESLARQMGVRCGHCAGTGMTRSAESTCHDVLRALLRISRQHPAAVAGQEREYLIRAAEAVVERLIDEEAWVVDDLRARTGARVRFEAEPSYRAGQFDVVLVDGAG